MDFKITFEKLESEIRQGEIANVQQQLQKLSYSDIPRAHLADFADIARRVRLEYWGLKILRPIVRPQVPVHPKVSDQELCVYAGLLIKVGALPEATALLEKLDSEKIPQVNTFLSQIHIAEWNYESAVKDLKATIKNVKLTPYQVCIAEVNLAASYLFLQQIKLAEKLLSKIILSCEQNKWDLLFGNALELLAQLAVAQKDWNKARKLLSDSQTRVGQHPRYQLFIQKWIALVKVFEAKSDSREMNQALAEVKTIRDHAVQLNAWETIRDLDYHTAIHLKQKELLLNIYFGTPYKEYKKRIQGIFKTEGWDLPDFYFRNLSHEPATAYLDVQNGTTESEMPLPTPLKQGQALHRLLLVLSQDFYKPTGPGEIFSKIFPDEYFNHETSPERIVQAVKRLRTWFYENNIPVTITVVNGSYALHASRPYKLKILNKTTPAGPLNEFVDDQHLQSLKAHWPYKAFSLAKATEFLNIPKVNVQKILKKAFDQKNVFKSGVASATLYRFQK